MRYRKSKNYKEKLADYMGNIAIDLETAKAKPWDVIFGNAKATYLEIGMGKGQFLRNLAKANPNNNYIGIEKIEPLLLGGCEKIQQENINNIKLIALNANYLEEYFGENSVEGIYLNFSDPWPKNNNANKRLTHKNMLKRYANTLKKGGFIEFKTDNEPLFDYSVKEMDAFGFKKVDYTRNLHLDKADQLIITTEYEDKFRKEGKEIFFVKYLVKNLENVQD